MSLFERQEKGDVAVIVHINFSQESKNEELEEFYDLVRSAGAQSVATITGSRQKPEAKYFLGTGKAEEIRLAVQENEANVVLVNHALSPAQERNLEHLVKCRVLDRTGVILDIFAQRARSYEGKLQVELAQLSHMATRLIRGWTHLERQKGGIGLRGPGETQLESDRRLLADRIKQIKKRLIKVRRQREQSRRSRKRAELPTVSLIGYTNAGKSTLFNRLSSASVYAENQLFATLDPTLRRIELDNKQAIVLADTVGFIRHLPHDLIDAFNATLQETKEADLLLHVVDAGAEELADHIQQVEQVINMVGAETVPQILVYNKIDSLGTFPRIDRDEHNKVIRVWISALEGKGLELLLQTIEEFFRTEIVRKRLSLMPNEGKLRSKLFEQTIVLEEQYTESGDLLIDFECSDELYQDFCRIEGFQDKLIT